MCPSRPAPDFDHDADTLDRAGYQVVFEEDFTAPALAADQWVAHYLPHWSTPAHSAARYDLDAGVLTLRIPKADEVKPRQIRINAGTVDAVTTTENGKQQGS